MSKLAGTINLSGTGAIACCMPAYNPGEELHESLLSLSASTVPVHLIIADDGSAVPVEVDFGRYGLSGEVIRLHKNRGVAAALNASISRALERGYDLIARLDSDDLAKPERFEQQRRFLSDNPDALAVFTSVSVIDGLGKEIGTIAVPNDKETLRRKMALNNVLIHPTAMFRASFFGRYGMYSEQRGFAEDYALFYKPALDGTVGLLSEKLVYYRVHENSVSFKKYRSQLVNRLFIQSEHLRESKLHGLLGIGRTLLLLSLTVLPSDLAGKLRRRLGLGMLQQ